MRVLIVGGGIGGLTLGLMLHAVKIDCLVCEAVSDIRPLGVGINTLPHSIRELAALGLQPALDKIAIRTRKLTYANHLGQEIWSEPRGLFAGHDVPQFSIHRGQFQRLLWDALESRIGASRLKAGHRLAGYREDRDRVIAKFETSAGVCEEEADVLIGADGIHSAVRALLHPDDPGTRWNGITMWRGAVDWPIFDQGDSMIVAGNARSKLVLYPIGAGKTAETRLTNWVVYARVAGADDPTPPRESWSARGGINDVEPLIEGFDLPFVDLRKLIASTPDIFEYPMCDKDPLPWWTKGRATRLGDAAHPMYPVGSNGSAQAILDARALTEALQVHGPRAALEAYETERRLKTANVVQSNRQGGPERVIDLVATRAPAGFHAIDEVASRSELEAVVRGYAALAGFANIAPAAAKS